MRVILVLVMLVAAAGCANIQSDAPYDTNWSARPTWLSDDKVAIEMSLKHVHLGGDGEASQVFRDLAITLMRQHGYASYTILRYEERIESNWFSQRQAYGEVAFAR